jgi:putative flippase GtrA
MIPERHRKLVRELTAFGFAGVINTAIGFALFNMLLGLGSLTANALSTSVATGTSFVLNRYVTYRHRPKTSLRRELPLFVFFNLIGLGIQQLIMIGGKWAFDLSDADRLELNVVRMGSVAVGTVFLLLTYRTFVFKKGPVEAPVSAELPIPVEFAQDVEFADLTAPLESESIDTDWELGAMLESDEDTRTVRSRL